jgi:hypothetical protein
MRRLLTAAALAAVVLTGAACSKSEPTANGSTPTPSATAATSAPPGLDLKTACTQVNALIQQEVLKYAANTDQIQKQLASGDMTKVQAAADQLKAFFISWATDLEAAAAKASDPDVKKAMTDLATLLRTGAANVDPNNLANSIGLLNTAAFSAAGAQLNKICGSSS